MDNEHLAEVTGELSPRVRTPVPVPDPSSAVRVAREALAIVHSREMEIDSMQTEEEPNTPDTFDVIIAEMERYFGLTDLACNNMATDPIIPATQPNVAPQLENEPLVAPLAEYEPVMALTKALDMMDDDDMAYSTAYALPEYEFSVAPQLENEPSMAPLAEYEPINTPLAGQVAIVAPLSERGPPPGSAPIENEPNTLPPPPNTEFLLACVRFFASAPPATPPTASQPSLNALAGPSSEASPRSVVYQCPEPPFINQRYDSVDDGWEALRNFSNDLGFDLTRVRVHYKDRTSLSGIQSHIVLKCNRRLGNKLPEQLGDDCPYQVSVRLRAPRWILTVDHELVHNHAPVPLVHFRIDDLLPGPDPSPSGPSRTLQVCELFLKQGLIGHLLRGGASPAEALEAIRANDPGSALLEGDIVYIQCMMRQETRRQLASR